MGNCGSAPAVKDDPPRKPSFPSQSISGPTSGTPSKPLPNQPSEPPPSRTKESVSNSKESSSLATSSTRKSKSMEIAHTDRSSEPGPNHTKSGPRDPDDDDDDNEDDDGGWKVRRRVSRRLSLEVQKRPGAGGSKAGSPSPAWGAPPTPSDQATWELQADADLMTSPAPPLLASAGAAKTSAEGKGQVAPAGRGGEGDRATTGVAG